LKSKNENRFRRDAARRAKLSRVADPSRGAAIALDVHEQVTYRDGRAVEVKVFGASFAIATDGTVMIKDKRYRLSEIDGRVSLLPEQPAPSEKR
jgi:hypothetical protein